MKNSELEMAVDVNLLPGELHIAGHPTLVKTILGSCLSVIFFHRRTAFGAISHAQLPAEYTKTSCADGCPVKCFQDAPASSIFKYVSCSLEYMLDQFSSRGIPRSEIEIKLFGAADVLLGGSEGRESIGKKNIAMAHSFLARNKLTVTSEDVGGRFGRTIYFYSDTGRVLVRKHKNGNL